MSESSLRVSLSEADGGFARVALHALNDALGPTSRFAWASSERTSGRTVLEMLPRVSVAEAAYAVMRCEAEIGILPSESSRSGVDRATVDDLVRGGLEVIAEIVIPAAYALVAPRSAIKKIAGYDYEVGHTTSDVGARREAFSRASESFVFSLTDIFGSASAFAQTDPILKNVTLSKCKHHRTQDDPVRMAHNVAEAALLSAPKSSQSARVSSANNDGARSTAPIFFKNEVSAEGESVAAPPESPACDVQHPSVRVAALAPKGLFNDELGHSDYAEVAPHHLRHAMVELAAPQAKALGTLKNTLRFLVVARSGSGSLKALRELLAKAGVVTTATSDKPLRARRIFFSCRHVKAGSVDINALAQKLGASLSRHLGVKVSQASIHSVTVCEIEEYLISYYAAEPRRDGYWMDEPARGSSDKGGLGRELSKESRDAIIKECSEGYELAFRGYAIVFDTGGHLALVVGQRSEEKGVPLMVRVIAVIAAALAIMTLMFVVAAKGDLEKALRSFIEFAETVSDTISDSVQSVSDTLFGSHATIDDHESHSVTIINNYPAGSERRAGMPPCPAECPDKCVLVPGTPSKTRCVIPCPKTPTSSRCR